MSRRNYDKLFYVDVGTSVAAIRCASNGDVVDWMDHHGKKDIIKIIEDKCDRLNQEAKQFYAPTGNAATMREALKKLVDVIDMCASSSPLWWHNGAQGVIPLKNAKAALSLPPRNCDRFRDVNEAYNRFMSYVKRENPSYTKSSPLHTVWDALKWVLDCENENKGEEDENV